MEMIPIPMNEFDSQFLKMILEKESDEKRMILGKTSEVKSLILEKTSEEKSMILEKEKLRMAMFQSLISAFAVILSSCILTFGLVSLGARASKSVDNVAIVLERYIQSFDGFVVTVNTFSLKKAIFGR